MVIVRFIDWEDGLVSRNSSRRRQQMAKPTPLVLSAGWPVGYKDTANSRVCSCNKDICTIICHSRRSRIVDLSPRCIILSVYASLSALSQPLPSQRQISALAFLNMHSSIYFTTSNCHYVPVYFASWPNAALQSLFPSLLFVYSASRLSPFCLRYIFRCGQ